MPDSSPTAVPAVEQERCRCGHSKARHGGCDECWCSEWRPVSRSEPSDELHYEVTRVTQDGNGTVTEVGFGDTPAAAIRDLHVQPPADAGVPEHRCGVKGFNGMLGDVCPACEARHGTEHTAAVTQDTALRESFARIQAIANAHGYNVQIPDDVRALVETSIELLASTNARLAHLTAAHETAVREKEDAMHRAYITGFLDGAAGTPGAGTYERLRAEAEGKANAYVKARSTPTSASHG